MSRLGTAAAVAGVPCEPLLAWIGAHELEVGEAARVGIDDAFSRVTLRVPWPAHKAATLIAAIEERRADVARAFEAALARPAVAGGEAFLELTAGAVADGLGFSLHVTGGRPLVLDALLLDSALGACPSLKSLLSTELGSQTSVGLSVGSEGLAAPASAAHLAGAVHLGVAATDDATRALATAAEALAVATPQRILLADVHPILRRGKAAQVSVGSRTTATGTILEEALMVTYRELPMTHLVRILVGLHRGTNIGAQLGAFAGAFDVEHASAFSLTLTPTAPRAQVFVDLHGGRAV